MASRRPRFTLEVMIGAHFAIPLIALTPSTGPTYPQSSCLQLAASLSCSLKAQALFRFAPNYFQAANIW
jgi:hypothetical protein